MNRCAALDEWEYLGLAEVEAFLKKGISSQGANRLCHWPSWRNVLTRNKQGAEMLMPICQVDFEVG
jgi:hypothetical protein